MSLSLRVCALMWCSTVIQVAGADQNNCTDYAEVPVGGTIWLICLGDTPYQVKYVKGTKNRVVCTRNMKNQRCTAIHHADYTGRITDFPLEDKLGISNASLDDGGLYTCSTYFCTNTSLKELHRIVIDPPHTRPSALIAGHMIEGQSRNFTCNSTAKLIREVTWTYSWQRSDGPLSERIRYDNSSGVLNVVGVSRYDDAYYACTISNIAGNLSSEGKRLEVYYRPEIEPSINGVPGSVEIVRYESEAINLTCSVSGGHPLANLTWDCGFFVPNETIHNETIRSSLHGKANRTHHNKSCTCKVYQEVLRWKDLVVNMTIYYGPNLPEVNVSNNILENQTTVATCEPGAGESGNPVSNFTWVIQDEIKGYGRKTNLTLSKDFNGKVIYCVLKNAFTEKMQKPVNGSKRLNIEYSPVIFLPESYTARENSSVTINCTADSNPRVEENDYMWYKLYPNKTLQETKRNQVLNLQNVTKRNAGTYVCNVSTTSVIHGSLQSNKSTKLVVQYLELSGNSSSVQLEEGEALHLFCEADGVPAVYDFKIWNHTGPYQGRRSMPGNLSINSTSLNITSVLYADTGLYFCGVSNDIDHKTKCYNVSIYFPPKNRTLAKTRETVYSAFGGNVSLQVEVLAFPQLVNFTWYKSDGSNNKVEIDANDSQFRIHNENLLSQIYIYNITSYQPVNYTLHASNGVKNGSEFGFTVVVRDEVSPPEALDEPFPIIHVVAIAGGLIMLTAVLTTVTIYLKKRSHKKYADNERKSIFSDASNGFSSAAISTVSDSSLGVYMGGSEIKSSLEGSDQAGWLAQPGKKNKSKTKKRKKKTDAESLISAQVNKKCKAKKTDGQKGYTSSSLKLHGEYAEVIDAIGAPKARRSTIMVENVAYAEFSSTFHVENSKGDIPESSGTTHRLTYMEVEIRNNKGSEGNEGSLTVAKDKSGSEPNVYAEVYVKSKSASPASQNSDVQA